MRNHGSETSIVRVRYRRENSRANPGAGKAAVALAVAALRDVVVRGGTAEDGVALLRSCAASQRGLSASEKRSRRKSSATTAVVPTINLPSDELLLCHRIAIATAAPSSIPTDCSAMVATTIRLRSCLGAVSDTQDELTGKSMPMPTPTMNWPIRTHCGAVARALIRAPIVMIVMSIKKAGFRPKRSAAGPPTTAP